MVDFGIPADMKALLAQKYSIMRQQANAETARSNALANLQNQQAGVVKSTAASENALRQTQGTLNNASANKAVQEANMVKPMGMAQIGAWNAQANQYNANAGFLGAQTSRYNDEVDSKIGLQSSQAGLLDSQSSFTDMETRYKPKLFQSETDLNDAQSYGIRNGLFSNFQLRQRGVARVPGKGEGDKVPTMLEPGEAVLNKHAAGMIGRDKIAQANKKGNQMRSKENLSKLVQAIKMAGMV